MSEEDGHGAIILVVEDSEETRDGIEALLTANGYRVIPARHEEEAVGKARRARPDLILLSPGGAESNAIATAVRIRHGAELGQEVPVVLFCIQTIAEGAEVEMGMNVHITRPENFEQLRGFLRRLLERAST